MKISDSITAAIVVEKLSRPLHGGLEYAVKVTHLYIEDAKGRRKIDRQFGETWGKTSEDACNKMRAIVQQWVASQANL